MNKLFLIFLIVFFLSNCSTSYQQNSFTGGYSDTKLSDNIFRVDFEGNGYTKSGKTIDFALLRSAEIALENGFKYFTIVSSDSKNSYSTFTTPQTTSSTGSVNMYGKVNVNSITNGGQTYLVEKPTTSNIIVCFKKKPKSGGIIYDANYIVKSIKNKYRISPLESYSGDIVYTNIFF